MRLAALLLALAFPVQAQVFVDGNSLLERMNDSGVVKPMMALGFVLGAP